MPKFRKKPVVIEAVQYVGSNLDEALRFCNDGKTGDEITRSGAMYFTGPRELCVRTLESRPGESLVVAVGDWIIRGVKNEVYPCKPDIFEATYEPHVSSREVLSAIEENIRAGVIQ